MKSPTSIDVLIYMPTNFVIHDIFFVFHILLAFVIILCMRLRLFLRKHKSVGCFYWELFICELVVIFYVTVAYTVVIFNFQMLLSFALDLLLLEPICFQFLNL